MQGNLDGQDRSRAREGADDGWLQECAPQRRLLEEECSSSR